MLKSKPFRLFSLILLLGVGGYFYANRSYPITNYPPRAGEIVAFGDSLTQGVGARAGESYPAELERLIGRPVVNAGVGGNTTTDAEARLAKDVLTRRPAVVILLIGGNDFLQHRDTEQAFASIERMIHQIQDKRAMVVLVDPWFMSLGPYSHRFSKLARATGCPLVPGVLRGIFTDPQLKADPIHPNAAGYKIMATRIAEVVKKYL
jgi:lysophospholipase L1-like esterase